MKIRILDNFAHDEETGNRIPDGLYEVVMVQRIVERPDYGPMRLDRIRADQFNFCMDHHGDDAKYITLNYFDWRALIEEARALSHSMVLHEVGVMTLFGMKVIRTEDIPRGEIILSV